MEYLIPPEAPVAVPVAGSPAAFAVRRVYCVGRNYAGHAREMGADERDPPFFFCKPGNAVVVCPPQRTADLPYPPLTADFQHEIELVAAIGKAGRDIAPGKALDHVFGYAVGLDMTRRDLQAQMKKQARPWEVGKAFDASAPIGPIHPAAAHGHPQRGAIWCQVDGQDRQRGDLSQMMWSVAETLANLSTLFELRPGDLVYTGTPEGVGAVQRGQTLAGGIDGLGEIRLRVV